MKYRMVYSPSSPLHRMGIVIGLGLLAGSPPLVVAAPPLETLVKTQIEAVSDLGKWAENRPRKCQKEKEPATAWRGWKQLAVQCTWHNRLQVRRWVEETASDPNACVSRPALWWASGLPVSAGSVRSAGSAPAVWNRAWLAQSISEESTGQKKIRIIARNANKAWEITEWIWAPSPRIVTRAWQQARWKRLADVAMNIQQLQPKEHIPQETALWRKVWEKNLKGSVGEVSAGGWHWQRNKVCMRMEAVGVSQALLHLPYSQDDGRLEQRAAMQLKLARLYPKATWLTPFRLLPVPVTTPATGTTATPAATATTPISKGGAKYEAIWNENGIVKGQLWMPSKGDGPVLRARIAVTLSTGKNNGTNEAVIEGIAQSIDQELISLATLWELNND